MFILYFQRDLFSRTVFECFTRKRCGLVSYQGIRILVNTCSTTFSKISSVQHFILMQRKKKKPERYIFLCQPYWKSAISWYALYIVYEFAIKRAFISTANAQIMFCMQTNLSMQHIKRFVSYELQYAVNQAWIFR
jgi:hypothetical protein